MLVECSDGVVRSIIPAFRAEDPGSNPGRSIDWYFFGFFKKGLIYFDYKSNFSDISTPFTIPYMFGSPTQLDYFKSIPCDLR